MGIIDIVNTPHKFIMPSWLVIPYIIGTIFYTCLFIYGYYKNKQNNND